LSEGGINLWVNSIVAASFGIILLLAGIFPIRDDDEIMRGRERGSRRSG